MMERTVLLNELLYFDTSQHAAVARPPIALGASTQADLRSARPPERAFR